MTAGPVRDALERHGDRYLRRAFTPAEVADCTTGGTVDATRLAARFAAKEAVKKLLRTDNVTWRSVEIVRHPEGWTGVSLSACAARTATEQGVGEIALSFSHEGDYVSAIAVAEARA